MLVDVNDVMIRVLGNEQMMWKWVIGLNDVIAYVILVVAGDGEYDHCGDCGDGG